jgi:energy-converting hydrogenase Eha subunit C
MAVYAPRNLKIRLGVDYCFALMKRVYPKIKPDKVLLLTEGIDNIPSFLAFIIGVICVVMKLDYLSIGLYSFIAASVGFLTTTLGLFIIPYLPQMSLFYAYIGGWYIPQIGLLVLGYFTLGWKAVAALIIGRLISMLVNGIISLIHTKIIYKKLGTPLTAAERNFINAFRLSAEEVGVSRDLSVEENDLEYENWKEVYEYYRNKYPEAAMKCK